MSTPANPTAPLRASVGLGKISEQGGRDYNEDSCGYWMDGHFLCCVVADGAGGHGGGDIASRLVVKHILEQVEAAPLRDPAEVEDLLMDANNAVLFHQQDGDAERNMHTTVVALFIDLQQGQALWGHAGDSRLYIVRQQQIRQLTRDHSLVQGLVDAGLLRPEQMRTHPQRSQLASALGSSREDLLLSVSPHAFAIADGDAFLLCSDGIWEYLDEQDPATCLAQADNAQHWVDLLGGLVRQNAAAANKPRHDNYTALGLWFRRDVPEED